MSNVIRQWSQADNPEYRRIKLPHAGQAVPTITCLLFSKGKIIAATDTASIYVYSADTGRLRYTLNDHKDGVWALQIIDDMLVSGSVDKTIRVWNLESGQCTYVFAGHQGTVRCLQIIKPSWNVYVDPESHMERKEWWPARPYLVSGGRDGSVRLWALPNNKAEDTVMGDDNSKVHIF
jgi:F-box and WD-40 domain protein CDC4